jgi:hypothetical protein
VFSSSARAEAARGERQARRERLDPLLHGDAAVAAGMKDEVFRADQESALQLAAESLDGFRADHRIGRGQVDQVINVDGQRVQIELPACGAQQLHPCGVGRRGAPHARTGGEDLKGVGPQFGSSECGILETAGGEGVNP